MGTPFRTNSSFTQSCNTVACPGSSNSSGVLSLGNGTAFNPDVPANITEVFSSVIGTHGSTLSGPWDIQYRQFSSETDYGITYSTGTFRVLDMLILHNKVEPVEGLIVNTDILSMAASGSATILSLSVSTKEVCGTKISLGYLRRQNVSIPILRFTIRSTSPHYRLIFILRAMEGSSTW